MASFCTLCGSTNPADLSGVLGICLNRDACHQRQYRKLRDRAERAEAKVIKLEAALRRHMPLLDERGTPLCGGCLEPSPCPDAALCSEEADRG